MWIKLLTNIKKSKSDFIGSNGFPHGFVPVGIKKEALEKICELKVTDDTETGYRDFFTEKLNFSIVHTYNQVKMLNFLKILD